MKRNVTLTITSLLSILFFTFHHADDVRRGLAPGGFINLVVVGFLAVWLYGTLAFTERRAGYVIILLFSLLGLFIPAIHMTGSGLAGSKIANSGGAFFFVWTLLAFGVTALCSLILAARRLWGLRQGSS